MADDKVVDLSKEFALDDRAKGFLASVRSLAAVTHMVRDILSTLTKAEQRALCQVMAARLEGAAAMTASQNLVRAPLLIGMPFDHIVQVYDDLVTGEVLQTIITGTDKKGQPTSMAFRWEAFERLMILGEEMAAKPQPKFVTPGGAPLV